MDYVVLVDTDVFSYLWQNRPQANRFRPHLEGLVHALCFTTVGEAWSGAFKRSWGERKRRELDEAISPYLILPYDRDLAFRWGRLRALLDSQGVGIPDNDLWIAATALHYDVALATNNRKHFERVAGLRLVP